MAPPSKDEGMEGREKSEMDSEDRGVLPHFYNKNNKKICCKYWVKDESFDAKPRALVMLAHGVCEHLGYYDVIAKPLADLNFFVFGHDHVGHGLSEGDRVHVESFDEYIDDLMQHVALVRKRRKVYADLPLFVVAHSMGGAVAIRTALLHPNLIAGMVLIGPAIIPNEESSTPFKAAVATVVDNIRYYLLNFLAWISPQVSIAVARHIGSDKVSRRLSLVERYSADPLIWHGGLKAKWAVETLNAMYSNAEKMSEFHCPFLILHGDEDIITDIRGSRMMAEKAASKDKTLKEMPGAYHNLHNELPEVSNEVIKMTLEWISERT